MTATIQPTHYYLDANALWKYYRDEPGAQVVHRLVSSNSCRALISHLTMLEFIGVLMKYYRRGQLDRRQVRRIAKRVRRDASSQNSHRRFLIVDIPVGAFREAESILLEHAAQYNFGSNDALHLGLAVRLMATASPRFVTSDGSLKLAAMRKSVICFDPECDTLP